MAFNPFAFANTLRSLTDLLFRAFSVENAMTSSDAMGFQDSNEDLQSNLYNLTGLLTSHLSMALINPDDFWLLRLTLILLGYASVLVPEEDHYFRKNAWLNFVRQFAIGQPEYSLVSTDPNQARDVRNIEARSSPQLFAHQCILLLIYALGIQVTLISMGFFQERIMTLGYARYDNLTKIEPFGDAQFLVFANRIVALVLVGCYMFANWRKLPPHVPPLYTHSFISISNTISSWCQYEALKFVSFPTQTVFKAAKVVPTMIMGHVLRNDKRPTSDYLMGCCLAVGAGLFFLSTQTVSGYADTKHEVYFGSAISGIILMAGYLFFDAFTLNWQKKLFDTKPKISRYQVSLLEQGTLFTSIAFLMSHTGFARDVFLLSVSNAVGQLFIYVTIERFGPVVFAVIMTIRQILSIILSTIYFSHSINFMGILGLTLAFGSLIVDSYVKYCRSRHLHHLLICIYGVQVTVVSTGFFQERLYSLAYESTESGKAEVFGDSNFVTIFVRAFVLSSITVFYLLKNTTVEHLCPSFLCSKSGLTSVLFCCAICLSTLSIGTTQLFNDGTTLMINGFLFVLLLISGAALIRVLKDAQFELQSNGSKAKVEGRILQSHYTFDFR
ncbi:Adenosine 3'-phospho 5'-phosphosulfate transporter 1 [Aphelenchoides besseyi]|nr:Adenosine 3'-phospho 5'-phosphosulfate transporter 1 [Aphelenchoides besseyi]